MKQCRTVCTINARRRITIVFSLLTCSSVKFSDGQEVELSVSVGAEAFSEIDFRRHGQLRRSIP
jgi:hypothetical protein